MDLLADFEAARPRLLSLAHRMLGSLHDAEDAVQTTWLRAQAAHRDDVRNPEGWLTTVTARLCLDQLRLRVRRSELPLLDDAGAVAQLAADEEFLRREDVSRALLVVLDQLTPTQRVAYVLHDLFGVPFGQIADVLDTSLVNSKKLASRARRRLRDSDLPAEPGEIADHVRIVDAFLAAARGGDINHLINVLAPDVVRTVDLALLPEGSASEVHGARTVAEETTSFIDRVRATVVLLVDGAPAAVIAPGGHPIGYLRFTVAQEKITRIAIRRLGPGNRLSGLGADPR